MRQDVLVRSVAKWLYRQLGYDRKKEVGIGSVNDTAVFKSNASCRSCVTCGALRSLCAGLSDRPSWAHTFLRTRDRRGFEECFDFHKTFVGSASPANEKFTSLRLADPAHYRLSWRSGDRQDREKSEKCNDIPYHAMYLRTSLACATYDECVNLHRICSYSPRGSCCTGHPGAYHRRGAGSNSFTGARRFRCACPAEAYSRRGMGRGPVYGGRPH